MSVINQMLKDLDGRQQQSDAELAAEGPVYAGQSGSKPNWILYALLIAILIALSVIGWQLVTQESADAAGKSAKVALEPQVKPEDVTANSSSFPAPEILPSAKIKAFQGEATVANIETTAPIRNEALVNQPRQSEAASSEAVTSDTLIEDSKQQNPSTKPSSVDSGQWQREPVEAEPAENKPAETMSTKGLVIEKSSNKLTREQQVEKLLAEAKKSYDKGYITEAIDKLEQLLRFDDTHIEARNLLAGAWYGRGELNSAVAVINDGLQRYPLIDAWRLTAAKIFFKENNIVGAFSYLDIDLNAASKEFYTMKGTLARQLRAFAKAEIAYRKLTELEPSSGNWWLGLAIVLDSQEKWQLAIDAYQSVLRLGGVSSDSANFAANRIDIIKEQL